MALLKSHISCRVILSVSMFAGALLLGLTAIKFSSAVAMFDETLSPSLSTAQMAHLDHFMIGLTMLGDGGTLIWVGGAVVAALLAQRAWRLAAIYAGAFVATPLLVTALKLTYKRARPIADLYSGPDVYSFPSGHMANAAVIFGGLALLLFTQRKWGDWLLGTALGVLVVMIGLSRIYLEAHWPSDVIGSGLMAIAILAAIHRLMEQTFRPIASKRAAIAGLIALLVAGGWRIGTEFEIAQQRYGFLPHTTAAQEAATEATTYWRLAGDHTKQKSRIQDKNAGELFV